MNSVTVERFDQQQAAGHFPVPMITSGSVDAQPIFAHVESLECLAGSSDHIVLGRVLDVGCAPRWPASPCPCWFAATNC